LIKVLYDDDVIVDYIWMVVSGYPHLVMHAIVTDENDEMCQCVARWVYDHSKASDPLGPHYIMVDVELTDLPGGIG